MKTSEALTLAGILVTVYALWVSSKQIKTSEAKGGGSRRLQKARQWQGNGVDPFGSSYTVEKQAAAGGLS